MHPSQGLYIPFCTWMCLDNSSLHVLLLLRSLPQGPELEIDMSTLERPVLLLEMSSPQQMGRSCTWTCLDNNSLCCSWADLHYRFLCCTRTCLHNVPELHLDLSALPSPVLHLDGFPLQGPEVYLDVFGQQ